MDCNLAQKYWELGNAIVAFSVLQMLAFLYSLANKEFRAHVVRWYRFVRWAILVSSIVYIAGVICCYEAEISLRGARTVPTPWVLSATLYARAMIIAAYSALGAGVLIVGRRH
jgi:hypothetical protein